MLSMVNFHCSFFTGLFGQFLKEFIRCGVNSLRFLYIWMDSLVNRSPVLFFFGRAREKMTICNDTHVCCDELAGFIFVKTYLLNISWKLRIVLRYYVPTSSNLCPCRPYLMFSDRFVTRPRGVDAFLGYLNVLLRQWTLGGNRHKWSDFGGSAFHLFKRKRNWLSCSCLEQVRSATPLNLLGSLAYLLRRWGPPLLTFSCSVGYSSFIQKHLEFPIQDWNMSTQRRSSYVAFAFAVSLFLMFFCFMNFIVRFTPLRASLKSRPWYSLILIMVRLVAGCFFLDDPWTLYTFEDMVVLDVIWVKPYMAWCEKWSCVFFYKYY